MLKFITDHPPLSLLAALIGVVTAHITQDASFPASIIIGLTGAVFAAGVCVSLHRLIEQRKRLASIRQLRGE